MMRRALLPAAMLWSSGTAAWAAPCALPTGGREVNSPDGSIALSYRPDPAGLGVDRQFSLLVHACAAMPIEAIVVDAHMPDHRHGMNYKPSVSATAVGAWRADGLLLHMPGKWEFVFVVSTGGRRERLTDSVQVK